MAGYITPSLARRSETKSQSLRELSVSPTEDHPAARLRSNRHTSLTAGSRPDYNRCRRPQLYRADGAT
jgi:hypothetical protein